jgi:signal transduction histidine kinase
MRARGKAALAAVIFTAAVLAAVNIGWWWYYRSITAYLEQQLSWRLTNVAATAALHVSAEQVAGLAIENLTAYADVLLYLDSLTVLDSLSEAAVLDLDFNYLVSTRQEIAAEGYLLARPNFDTLNAAVQGRPTASALYNLDGTYLKSAYAPLYDSSGEVAAILVAEAGAGYFELLGSLRRHLIFLAVGSAGAVLVLLMLYIIYSRRLALAEEKLFQTGSQATLGRMVAVVSHEVKNPLMIMRAAGERLQKKYADPEASFIVDEVARLDTIVSGYLSFARGETALHREPVDPAELTRKVVAEFSPQFAERRVRLETAIADTLPTITVDKIGFRQTIINLLLNALEAASDSAEPAARLVRLELTASPQTADRIVLRVSDSGPGFSPAQRRRLFEPFSTTKTKGSGLGLFLCRRIVTAHGGDIRLLATDGAMTTLEITLPIGGPA